MELIQSTDRVYYYPFEEARDRPSLGYIRGDRWSMAVDAGHSDAHVAEFYDAIRRAGLPLPELTVLTHWHWDHTFGMHAVNGRCIAGERTAAYLADCVEKLRSEGPEAFLRLHASVRLEYAGGRPMKVTMPDMRFSGTMTLDAGNCLIRLLPTGSPHTDDCTLVQVVDEKVLFVGDAAGGIFPTWEKDPALCRALALTIGELPVDICVESHWEPESRDELVNDLLSVR